MCTQVKRNGIEDIYSRRKTKNNINNNNNNNNNNNKSRQVFHHMTLTWHKFYTLSLRVRDVSQSLRRWVCH